MFLKILLIILALFNLYTFFLMGWDKNLANKKKFRISEARFFQLALFGGSLGILTAMLQGQCPLRHCQHPYHPR